MKREKDDAGRAIERRPVEPPDGGAAWRALYEGPARETEPVEDDEGALAEAAA